MGTKNIVIGLLLGTLVAYWQFSTQSDSPMPSSLRSESVRAAQTVSRTSVRPDARDLESKSPAPRDVPADTLRQLLRESTKRAQLRNATPAQLANFQRLIARSLQTPIHSLGSLAEDWRLAGWEIHRCGADVIVISEHPDQRHGRGIYAIRIDSPSQITLQAPHRFYDEDSGLITRKLFLESSVRAAAWNTVHRRELDLAHCDEHYINAFTRALVTVAPSTQVMQLHGFSRDKYALDASSPMVTVQAILSNGTRFPDRHVLRLAANLKSTFSAQAILLYPGEVDVLGGTQNRQAKLLRGLGSNGFLHVELSREFRDRLLNDRQARQQFLAGFDSSKPATGMK